MGPILRQSAPCPLAICIALIVCTGPAGPRKGLLYAQNDDHDGHRTHARANGRAALGIGHAGIGAAIGGIGTYIWSANMEKRKREMQEATQGTGIGVSQTADNRLKLDIPSDVSFDTGRYDIKSNFAPILNRFADGLRSTPNYTVDIIGHTDSTGSDAVNNPLSINRANATRNYLINRGADGTRIYTEGRGSREPVASNATIEGRAQNRRVEIYMGEVAPQQR